MHHSKDKLERNVERTNKNPKEVTGYNFIMLIMYAYYRGRDVINS